MRDILRNARLDAGLTQAELAHRLNTTQSAIARLEARDANPRLNSVERVLHACGQVLELHGRLMHPSIDETLVAGRLRLDPGERLTSFERSYANVREVALAGRLVRGESV